MRSVDFRHLYLDTPATNTVRICFFLSSSCLFSGPDGLPSTSFLASAFFELRFINFLMVSAVMTKVDVSVLLVILSPNH